MTRSLQLLAAPVLVLLVACSTAKPATEPVPVDPVTEPTVAGALDEALLQGGEKAAEAAETGRRIGRVAGLAAAIFGGPKVETLDETIDRYRRTRDAFEITAAMIGAAEGAMDGAQRGYQLDLQFAELHRIPGVEATRPTPDTIEVRFVDEPTPDTLADVASVFAGREERSIAVIGAGDAAFDVRESLIGYGVPAESLEAHRDDEAAQIVLRIGYLEISV